MPCGALLTSGNALQRRDSHVRPAPVKGSSGHPDYADPVSAPTYPDLDKRDSPVGFAA
jgi:hypothetical protein